MARIFRQSDSRILSPFENPLTLTIHASYSDVGSRLLSAHAGVLEFREHVVAREGASRVWSKTPAIVPQIEHE